MLSAPGIISLQIAKFVYEGVVGLELGLIGLIVLFELFGVRRGWCNYACPVGGFLGLFRFQKTLKVVMTEDAEHVCGKCNACVAACQLGLNPMAKGIYPLCHNCGACISACKKIAPKREPLSFRF
jgi:ferredoxin-type protein NapH